MFEKNYYNNPSSNNKLIQDPILMERSLRYNIDPLQQFTDDEIKKAINLIGFGYIIENNSKGLDMIV